MTGDSGDISTGELSRQVRDVLSRFSDLATRLETQFLRSDVFILYQRLQEKTLQDLDTAVQGKATKDSIQNLTDTINKKADKAELQSLIDRLEDLEDDKKWLTRLVFGFIVLGVLGAIFAFSQLGGSN